MNKLLNSIRVFAADDNGAQVIEYSLIVAVVSIALVVALRGILGSDFTGFIGRVNNCLMNSVCT